MNMEMIEPTLARAAARELFLLLHRDGAEWFDLAWEAAALAPRPDDWTQAWRNLPGLGATGGPDPATQQMARDFAAMATTFLIQSPTAREALLARLSEACGKRGYARPIREWITQAAEEILGGRKVITKRDVPSPSASRAQSADYLVWSTKAHEPAMGEPEACNSDEVARRFWGRRREFDLFVNGRMAFAPKSQGNNELQLTEDEYRALVLLMLQKGQPVKPVLLYRVVYQQQGLVQGQRESDILVNRIKSLMSRVRGKISEAVPAFDIPDKRTLGGYAAKGAFEACLVLAASDAEFFRSPSHSQGTSG